jgi:sigma-B regulation protein RsbU (phosphoserine phosphatase)
MRRRMQFTLGAIFFAFLLIYGGKRFYNSFSLLGMESSPGWTARQSGNQVRVGLLRNVEPPGAVREGDEVVELNGRSIKNASEVAAIFHDIQPGASYTALIRRGAVAFEVTLRSQEISLLAWIVNGTASLVIPNIFLLTGLIVFMLKPDDKQALLLALMFGMFNGAILAFEPAYAAESPPMVAIMLTVHLVSLFLWPVFFHFFLIFPEPSPLVRRIPRLEGYLYVPQLLTILPYFGLSSVLAAFAPEHAPAFRSRAITLISISIAIAYVAGGLLSLLVNYQQAGRKSRRKMRVVVAGSIAGFLPMFLLIGLAILFNLPGTNPLIQWLGIAALFSFPLFPLSFAYAIVRHQVIPVRLILRRGVRYLLISRGFIIIQAVVVFALLSFLLTGSRLAAIDRLGERADIIVTMAATALAIAGLTFLNQQVMPIIDRRFFRESYDAQQVLSELGLEMRKVSTVEQLLERAVAKIQDALHVEDVTIFLRDRESGDYVCAISSRLTAAGVHTSQDRELVLTPDGPLVRRMSRFTNPVPVDFDRYSPWAQTVLSSELSMNDLQKQENATLGRIRSALLLPVATKDELLGIVSLGPRLGDLPFSRDDRHLLMAVALQMAFAIQNAELVQEIAIEERLRHELAIATTVQQRLFPEHPPQIDSLDLSGVCYPARGVGGDYYDFIELEEGKLGIAVADVAGKGISAALLMCSVQASLRSQAPTVNGNLTGLVSSMNHLLHVSTDASAYATFFYAQFEESTRLLTYVNAGHNPPMLVKAGANVRAHGVGFGASIARDNVVLEGDSRADDVTLLTMGGPIIGAFHGSAYEQETVQLERGDLLVAYTDGVTEARNADDQEFGEARLRTIINVSTDVRARELSERIVQSVREWCGDVPPHDDLTLVVMRVR